MPGAVDHWKQRAVDLGESAASWWERRRRERPLLDWAGLIHQRDAEAFASVLGSAVALRLFLFVLPANVALVALVEVVRLGSTMDEHLQASATTGEIARSLAGISATSAAGFLLSGLALTLWAGRSLARTLATSSAAAWRLPAAHSKLRLTAMATLSTVLFATIAASSIFNRLREAGGVPATLAAWSGVLAVVTVAWFLVLLSLPRATSDPGALLPGAVLFGVGYTVLAWFMQFYLPNRIARSTDTLGNLASVVATLGWFFLIGRLASGSFVVSAVTFERFGSLSRSVFSLPVVRVLPRRIPRLVTYFDLGPAGSADAADGTGADSAAPAASGSS
jgi:Virulence factor BrkB